MTTMTLFGLALAPLYAAIAQVESDNGKTSPNIYQIDEGTTCYTSDVNRIWKQHCAVYGLTYRPFPPEAKFSRPAAEKMMMVYWYHWGVHYQKKTGKPVTYEVLARIHNGGPLGWKKPSTKAYWSKVQAVMKGGAK